MTRIFRLFPLVCLLALATPALAQPSFNCGGNLNRSERAICSSDRLSALDRRMVGMYRNLFRSLNEARQRRLRATQLTWLEWRNTCAGGAACLERRYLERITDFGGSVGGLSAGSSGAAAAGPDDVVETRIRDGVFETVYGDGRIVWVSAGESDGGTIFPDGTESNWSAIQVPGNPPPPLPPGLTEWGGTLEERLLAVIDGYLAPADQAPYRDIYADEPFAERMLSHIGAIQHLAQE